MNRTGFPRADIDVALYHDPKVVKLARRMRDPVQTITRLGLYQALILASWSAGERVTIEDAAPAWWTDDLDEVARDLADVGLVDHEARIPHKAWEAWYGPARDAREDRKFEGSIGGLIRSGMSREEAVKEAERRRVGQGSLEAPLSEPQVAANPERTPPGRPTPPTRPAGRGSALPPPNGGAAVAAADDVEDPRRALARAIREASSPDLRKRHQSRFDATYGRLYRGNEQESAA